MIEAVRKEKDTYLTNFAEFERRTAGRDPEWLRQMRKASILRVAEFGFPTTREEDWKYTNLSPLTRIPFQLAGTEQAEEPDVSAHPLMALPGTRLVFVNGVYDPRLSRVDGLDGKVRVQNLAHTLGDDPEAVRRHLGRYAEPGDNAFNALNTAFLREGAFVTVANDTAVEAPIYVIYLSTRSATPFVVHPRNVFVVGKNSQVQLVEAYLGAAEASYFTNPVTELIVEEAGIADHYKLQAESANAFHVGTVRTCQERDSTLRLYSLDLGGLLVRNNLTVSLDGEGGNAVLSGLYLGSGERHIDNHTRIEHLKAHCDSRELYKGILTDAARAVFHGRIVVSRGAQKTDSKQTNNNLLLSNHALVNTKPQLEIYADDVKCTHGATIGRLDEEALFYLRSRGIGEQAATNLLIYAFASEIIGRTRIDGLRGQLDEFLFGWLSAVQAGQGGSEKP